MDLSARELERAALAGQLAREALSRYESSLTAEGLAMLEAALIVELLTTPEGIRTLERLEPATKVDQSTEIDKHESGAPVPPRKRDAG